MLNITNNTVHCEEDLSGLEAPRKLSLSPRHMSMRNLLLGLLLLFILLMILPWTQTVRGDGRVTTLRPEQRPQTIHSTIAGRIERWYVSEGQFVRAGDTIVFLSEVKADYFDPQIVDRVSNQMAAKEGSIEAYSGKVGALEQQIAAMEQEQINKLRQLETKIVQARLKVMSDSMKIVEARLDQELTKNQYERTQALYDKQLKSLTELQDKRIKWQDAQTKVVSAENQYDISRNELLIYAQELSLTRNEFANKIAKARSDMFSTLSDQYDARGSVQKLSVERENYRRRQAFYYIVAPQDCYVVKAVKPGIGEIVKEGEPVVSILPKDYQLAVEFYVKPLDVPLVGVGYPVRFQFDGWPAFFFSGWPGASIGTYAGRVVAIDRNISANGKFRVLAEPTPDTEPWPERLQVGGGAHALALLNDVPVWYEIWRVINGFPPDFYQAAKSESVAKDEKSDKGS